VPTNAIHREKRTIAPELLCVCVAVYAYACASSPETRTAPVTKEYWSAPSFLLDLGRERTSLFGLPVDDIDTLEKKLRAAKGSKTRRETIRLLVFAHLRETDGSADARKRRRHRRQAGRLAQSLAKVTRDANVSAEMAFAELWMTWRAGKRRAGGIASRFVRFHRDNHELLYLAWTLRGEVAFESKRYREAERHFRYLIGVPGHPLYAYALFRSADCFEAMKKKDDADEARKEVVHLGCRDDAEPLVMRVVKQAMQRLRISMRSDPDGKSRPAVCPKPVYIQATRFRWSYPLAGHQPQVRSGVETSFEALGLFQSEHIRHGGQRPHSVDRQDRPRFFVVLGHFRNRSIVLPDPLARLFDATQHRLDRYQQIRR